MALIKSAVRMWGVVKRCGRRAGEPCATPYPVCVPHLPGSGSTDDQAGTLARLGTEAPRKGPARALCPKPLFLIMKLHLLLTKVNLCSCLKDFVFFFFKKQIIK